jgi:hypothetical protein
MAIRLWLGARFRRQSLAPRGATLAGFGGLTDQRSQAELRCQMMNANVWPKGFHLASPHTPVGYQTI